MVTARKPKKDKLLLTMACLTLTLSASTALCSSTDTSAPQPTQSDTTEAEKNKKALQLDDVVVRGDLSQKNLAATSSTVISREEITNRVYETPMEIVGLTPGVSVKQYKQGGTASSFQMRGFSSCSHGSDCATYLDGIPINEGDGYADTNIINPDELERVEVIKGPISPLYGNYASGGVVHFYTLKEVEGQHIKLQYGSFNTSEETYLGGFTSEDGKTDHVYSLLNYHTDGYQDNGEWDKQNAAARITHRFTDDFKARISLRAFNSDWDAPGWINKQQFDENPRQSANDTNAGSKDLLSSKLDLDYKLTKDSKILFHAFGYDQNFKRYYADSEVGKALGTNIGNLRDFDRLAYGTGASYNTVSDVWGRRLSLAVGTDYMMEDEDRQRWYLTAGNGRNKGAKYLDYNVEFQSIGLYTDVNYQIFKPLKVFAGGRYDHFSGDIVDHLLKDKESSMEGTDIFSPKGGMILSLLEDRLEFFGNVGRGFAMMSGFAEQAQYTQKTWDPQIRTQYELGMGVKPATWFNARLTGFRLQTTDDFIQDPKTLEYENAGETTRDGFELTGELKAFDHGYLRADYAYIDPKYDDYTVAGVSYDGKTLPNVPQDIVNIELGYNPPLGFGGWVRYHYEAGAELDRANTVQGEAFDHVDANVFYRFGAKAQYTVAVEVQNVLDEEYASSTSYSNGVFSYSPSLPISLYASFKVDF